MANNLLLRSLLFVPGTHPDRFARAFASGADAVVLDLEDSVEAGRKIEARDHIATFVATLGPETTAAVLVRVNAPGSEWIDDDADWLRGIGPFVDAVVLPKVEIAAAIDGVADAIPERRVIPLIETARGVLDAGRILNTDCEIPAVLFGAEDLTAELGIPRTLAGDEILHARAQIVLAAATIGADPIDAVWVHLTDNDGLRKDAQRAKALGFRGKMAIHPDQLPIINEAFSPTAAEVAAARKLVEADDEARANGVGVFRLNDQMVDAPIIRRARKILELADR